MDKPVVYTHSALKRKETLTPVTTWINLKGIRISKIIQI